MLRADALELPAGFAPFKSYPIITGRASVPKHLKEGAEDKVWRSIEPI